VFLKGAKRAKFVASMISKRTKLAAVYLVGVCFPWDGVVANRDANALGLDAVQKVRDSVAARHETHRARLDTASRSESDEDSRDVMAGELLDRAAAHKSLFGFGGSSKPMADTQPQAQALAVEKPQAEEPLTAEAKPKGESKGKPDQTQGGEAKSTPAPGPPASSEEGGGETTDSKAPDAPGIRDHVVEFKKVLDDKELWNGMWSDELADPELNHSCGVAELQALDTGSSLKFWKSKTFAQQKAADLKGECKGYAKKMEAADKAKKEFDELIGKVSAKMAEMEGKVRLLESAKKDVERSNEAYQKEKKVELKAG